MVPLLFGCATGLVSTWKMYAIIAPAQDAMTHLTVHFSLASAGFTVRMSGVDAWATRYASVVELVYTSDLKSDGFTAMRVQVPPLAPSVAIPGKKHPIQEK